MMKKKSVLSLLVISILLISISTANADLEDNLKSLTEKNAKNYFQPFVTAFGTNLNSGWFNTAEVVKPFHFGISLNSIGAFLVDDSEKTFIAVNPDTSIYAELLIETATVWGSSGEVFTPITTGDPLNLPDGLDISVLPMVVPQAYLGLPYGFEIIGRYLPLMEIEDIGDISFWGVGIKHKVSRWIPLCPTAISIQGTYQKFELDEGEVITIESTFLNAHISKKFLILTFYLGAGIENTKLSANYVYSGDVGNYFGEKLSFDIIGENEFRATFGARLKILILDACIDFSTGKYPAIRIGAGLTF